MDRKVAGDEVRLSALCNRLGRLWSEQPVQVWEEVAPWLFANHLVILKPCKVNTPLHCYDFTTCEFWVQVFGLPLERFYDVNHPQDDADETILETPQPPLALFPV